MPASSKCFSSGAFSFGTGLDRSSRSCDMKSGFSQKAVTPASFASHPKVPAKEIFEAAREKDIYVRYFDKPRINNYLRITIGTDEEMEKFLKFLTSFLKIQK